jgi:hypothetical protein
MMLALVLALAAARAAAPRALPLIDETVTVPAADWRGIGIPLRRQPARIECGFSVASGGSGVRVALLDRGQFERMNAGQGHRELAATAYRRSGGFAYGAHPGDYVLVVDNRMEGRGPAEVRLEVTLIFDDARPVPRTLSPERRAAVVALSVLFFAAVAWIAGRRLLRAFAAPPRGPSPPLPPLPPSPPLPPFGG